MADAGGAARPRLLIEEWLPAAAIGVECMRERGSASALAPTTFLHVWWARRPLAASRAAVLASVLPADFPHEVFERLMGFGRPSAEIVAIRELMDTGVKVEGGFGYPRAFKGALRERDVAAAHEAARALWGHLPTVIDPMAGGGSIPLESARLGFPTLANEYNPVACSVLEATLDYPFRLGPNVADRARHWGRLWEKAVADKLKRFFPKEVGASVHAYIFARTVPCPTTGHATPLVPDWHLLKPKGGTAVVAVPRVNKAAGTWTTEIAEIGTGVGRIAAPPPRTYQKGAGISLFTGEAIPADWIKAKAQAGQMGSALYAVALKTPQGLKFRPAQPADLDALAAAEEFLQQVRGDWEQRNLIPTEPIPEGSKTREPLMRGIRGWADMFSPRQLLGFGVLMEELHALRPQIIAEEGEAMGEAVVHLLAFAIDKMTNRNSLFAFWDAPQQKIGNTFARHDFAFRVTFAEMAPSGSGSGLEWVVDNTSEAFEEIAKLPHAADAQSALLSQGSATSLISVADGSLDAVVVDPPYSDNVQYSELADFFYVWLKRTQGHRRPEWFASLLCEHDQEAVTNDARFRRRFKAAKQAKAAAQAHYQRLMTEAFAEARRVLRPEGVLTVMFTHKKQEAWEALFASLIEAGFQITATWPVKTEAATLNIAKKNAAQSTVILVARVRGAGAGQGWFDAAMQADIRRAAESAAERLQAQGLNAVDQLVGSFGPAMAVFSAFDAVRTDTGQPVSVGAAIDIAADAVAAWRIRKLASQGLAGVEPEAQFALLCWDTLGAAEFRFNEAKLLGHAVGMEVDLLIAAGLISKTGDKIRMLSAADRRRAEPLKEDQAQALLFGWDAATARGRKVRKADALKIHPRDPAFRTSLDRAQALVLAHQDAGGGAAGIGAARALAARHGIKAGDATARLVEALVRAAPRALRRPGTAAARDFPEFIVWHSLLEPLFGIAPPDWTEKPPDRTLLDLMSRSRTGDAEDEETDAQNDEEDDSDDDEDEDEGEDE